MRAKLIALATIFCCQSAAASEGIVSWVTSKFKEEAVGALTGESIGFIKSLDNLGADNELRVMKTTNSVRVRFDNDGSSDKYNIGLGFPHKGKVNLNSLGDLWLPSGRVALTFSDDNGRKYPKRYTTIPISNQEIVISAKPTIYKIKGNKVPLNILTYPEGAGVRIMNIGPKYYAGMKLRPGKYDVLVEKRGYKPYRKKHVLSWSEPTFHVVLEPK